MTLTLGIDEAGRGPVIGPMVIAGVLISETNKKIFQKLGVKDSKLLTKQTRNRLIDEIKKLSEDYEIIIIPPKEIDAALNSPDLNLNKLEALKTARIIDKLNPDKAILDCPSINTDSYKEYVKSLLKNKSTKLIVEHKADLNHIEVAAASILAKVTRDNEIEKIRKKYGEIGPGYPSNPITQKFLKENWNKHPEIFRQTWETYKKIANSKSQKSLSDF